MSAVSRVGLAMSEPLPVSPSRRTSLEPVGMSQKCPIGDMPHSLKLRELRRPHARSLRRKYFQTILGCQRTYPFHALLQFFLGWLGRRRSNTAVSWHAYRHEEFFQSRRHANAKHSCRLA